MLKSKLFGLRPAKEKYADLHVHTDYSDSTLSPEEVIKTAVENDISAVAITDHDCVDAIPLCLKEGTRLGVEIIPGIELTVEYERFEVHILGYFIDWKAEWFRNKITLIQKSRIERIHKMVELLAERGIDVDPRKVFELAGHGSVGRLHLAKVMIDTRKIRSFREAFEHYIGHKKSCYIPHLKFTSQEAIDMVRKVGGVPVIAHPGLVDDDKLIAELAGEGLRGIEVYHTDHDRAAEKKFMRIAKKNGLLVTGGSDCHGMGKGRVLMGTVKVKYELVDKLREEAEKIRAR